MFGINDKKLKVLFVSSEVTPYAKTGGLADVAGALPKALLSKGCDARVIMPLYKCIKEKNLPLKKVKTDIFRKDLGHFDKFDLYMYQQDNVTTYFVENDKFFDREELYNTPEGDYEDNAQRFAFFSKAILAATKEIGFKADVLHLNDWQSALVPLYLKNHLKDDSFFDEIRTLFTIHNLAYQGLFEKEVMSSLDIHRKFFNMYELEFYDKLSFIKSGILYSDYVSTVSKGYACEILTEEYGCGLEGLLKTREDSLRGITNGVDYSLWDPKTDVFIKENYKINSLKNKQLCKKDLIDSVGLDIDISKPILGIITRLAHQKGMDLFLNIAEDLISMGVGIVVLGKGETEIEKSFEALESKYPKQVSVNIKFDNALAHKIEAGSDMFLMPSLYEPCGLNQMYSLRYGTIPVVRATGGLDDIIIDINEDIYQGNGFKFREATEQAFLDTMIRAIEYYNKSLEWELLLKKVMALDFSWGVSAEKYIALYKDICGK